MFMLERIPARCCGAPGIEVGGKGRSLHHGFDLRRIGHPPQQVPRLGFIFQQTGEDAARAVGKKPLLVLFLWQERGGYGRGRLLTVDFSA
jgi:hypothetical protein